MSDVPAVYSRSPLKVAVGVAVPAIEAWYLVGRHPAASEAAWMSRPSDLRHHDRKREFKLAAYRIASADSAAGVERATNTAGEAAKRVSDLIRLFPGGFAPFAGAVQGW